jgi:hypothetical protein
VIWSLSTRNQDDDDDDNQISNTRLNFRLDDESTENRWEKGEETEDRMTKYDVFMTKGDDQ